MRFLSFLFSKKSKDDILTSIFKIAEKGMHNINFALTPKGQFEVLMFDIWLGTQLVEEKNIKIDYVLMQNRIEDYLKQTIQKIGLSLENKYERVYAFREEGWEHDVLGLIHSDYPKTQQFLPCYMYLCMVNKPLYVFDDKTIVNKIEEISLSDVAEFLGPFCEHYSWLTKTIMNIIKYNVYE